MSEISPGPSKVLGVINMTIGCYDYIIDRVDGKTTYYYYK